MEHFAILELLNRSKLSNYVKFDGFGGSKIGKY